MANKTETITLRIEPAVKAGLKAMAERERRSIANMVEVLIRDYCHQKGIGIPEQSTATHQHDDLTGSAKAAHRHST